MKNADLSPGRARGVSGRQWLACLLIAASLVGCTKEPPPPPKAPPTPEEKSKNTISKAAFGTLPDGTAVDLYTMVNANGMEVRASNYGGIITALLVPDGTGKVTDITLGLKSFDDYVKNPPYFGAIIGRYGNRIGKAQFKIDDQTYKLPKNDGPNTLHGGLKGFDKVVWQAEPFEKEDSVG
ncbi:MAG TPA: hypothetical protein VGD45_00150, partial [Steroidobacter sp.]